MISVNHYDDEESVLFTGEVALPTDEGEPDRAVVKGEYPPSKQFFKWMQTQPDPHDHQPMPNWVIATVIIGTLGAMFAIGALIAK